MSITRPGGAKADLSVKQSVVDCLINHRRVIGNRRWGMVHLYYRAGLSLREIGRVFGINRQMVSYELRKARRLVAMHLQACRASEANDERSESVVDTTDEAVRMPGQGPRPFGRTNLCGHGWPF